MAITITRAPVFGPAGDFGRQQNRDRQGASPTWGCRPARLSLGVTSMRKTLFANRFAVPALLVVVALGATMPACASQLFEFNYSPMPTPEPGSVTDGTAGRQTASGAGNLACSRLSGGAPAK